MRKHFRPIIGSALLCVLFALGGCGPVGGANPGTSTGGAVKITTDRTTYQPGDTIQVSITNNLQVSIFAYDTLASCTILELQEQDGGTWQDNKLSRCALGRLARLIEIAPGKTYQASISAGTPGVQSPGFPAGTYRLVLKYTMSSQRPVQDMTTIYSVSVAVA